LSRQEDLDVFYRKIDDLRTACDENENIPVDDKSEITEYLELVKKDKSTYSIDELISAFNSVDDTHKQAYLIVTQNILLQDAEEIGQMDYHYNDELAEKLPGLIAGIPNELQDSHVDVLVAAATPPANMYGRSTSGLAEKISQQFDRTKADIFSAPHIEEEFQEYYLDVAKDAVVKQPIHATSILRDLPDIIEKNGLEKTREIVERGLKINEYDFKDTIPENRRTNLALFYFGIHAGHRFAGTDPQAEKELIDTLEKKLN